MNPAMNLPVASSPPMKTFEQNITPVTTSDASRCLIFNIPEHPKHSIEASPKHRRISELAAEWARDEQRRKALEDARHWVADTVHSQDGDTVRTLRLRKGWSQSQLAEAISSSQSHIARIERGAENLAVQTCRRLCKALDIDLNTLDQALRRQEAIAQEKKQQEATL
jgi:ribosome-binding protein aMBF1 (putative translation factor)